MKNHPHKIKTPTVFHRMMRWAYSLLLLLLLPLLLIVFRKKLHQPHDKLKGRRFAERFGSTPKTFQAKGVHIHCVSVGEINAAKGLIDSLLKDYPSLAITLTTSSVTGAVHAKNLFKETVQHCYLPIDLPWFMKRFYARIQPILTIVVEVEIWPNMVNQCVKHNCPIVLVNARMTERSLNSYKRVSWLFRHTLRQFHEICTQSSESFENFLAYGVYKKHLSLSRNMKFDLLPEPSDASLGKAIVQQFTLEDKIVIVAASTHEPEEKIMLDAFKKIKQTLNNAVLIIVPRHPHRFQSVVQIVNASGFVTQKASDFMCIKDGHTLPDTSHADDVLGTTVSTSAECIVVDTMGWLKACYSICDLAFIGGSFADKGGHNALEGALYAKPMVMGPSTFNNPLICQHLAEQNALVICDSHSALVEAMQYWLEHPKHAQLDGERGSKVLLRNAGAIEYTMSMIRPYLRKQ